MVEIEAVVVDEEVVHEAEETLVVLEVVVVDLEIIVEVTEVEAGEAENIKNTLGREREGGSSNHNIRP